MSALIAVPLRASSVWKHGALFLGLTLLVLALAASFGEQPVSLVRVFTQPDSLDATLFWSLRLPRVVLGALVGAGLAASGSTLQGLLRNPLADPFVLGVSGGAALGASLALVLGLGWGVFSRFSAPTLFAFVGAGVALVLVLAAGRGQNSRAPYAALLTGVVLNAFAAAAITLLKTLSDPDRLGELLYWLAGSLGYERGSTLAFAALLQGGALAVLVAFSGQLNLLSLGDDEAAALGVDAHRTRRVLLCAASASVAGAVALTGLIGFVGLIVPHLLRLVLGADQRLLVPLSALGGAAFLCGADLLARLAFPLFGAEPPVGVVTALLGGPLFLWLLQRRARTPA